jgi:hypothetical protein
VNSQLSTATGRHVGHRPTRHFPLLSVEGYPRRSAIPIADRGEFDEILLESRPNCLSRMLDLSRLRTIARLAEERRYTFEAVRQIVERFPSAAHGELKDLLEDSTVGLRSKVFVLYWLREFGKFDDLVTTYSPPFAKEINDVFQDVEHEEEAEDGVDPFSVEGFPDV